MSLPPPSSPAPVDHSNVRDLLKVTKTLTLVWFFLGVILAIVSLVSIFFAILFFHFAGGAVEGFVYYVLWAGVDLLAYRKIPGWLALLESGRYGQVKEPLLLWGILATVFGILPGLLLLVVYLRIMPWAESPPAPPA